MDLQVFFEPLSESFYQQKYSLHSIFNGIHFHGETFPDLTGIQLAIIGLEEYRGSTNLNNGSLSAQSIRKKLYALKKGKATCPGSYQ